MGKLKKQLIFTLIIVVFILIFVWSIPLLNSDEFKNFIEGTGIFAPLIIILYFIIAEVIAPLVAAPVILLGQTIFGIYYTLFYVYIGSVIASVISFYISQRFGRKLVAKLVGKKSMKEIDEFIKMSGTLVLIFGRIFGSAISEIISYAFGLTNMRFKKYFAITLLFGAVPYLILAVLFRFFNFSPINNILIWIGSIVILGGVFSYLVKRFLKNKRF